MPINLCSAVEQNNSFEVIVNRIMCRLERSNFYFGMTLIIKYNFNKNSWKYSSCKRQCNYCKCSCTQGCQKRWTERNHCSSEFQNLKSNLGIKELSSTSRDFNQETFQRFNITSHNNCQYHTPAELYHDLKFIYIVTLRTHFHWPAFLVNNAWARYKNWIQIHVVCNVKYCALPDSRTKCCSTKTWLKDT